MILLLKAMWCLAVCFSKANKKPSQWGEKFALDFPGGSDGKESAYNTGDTSLVPGSGRSPGERNGNPLQYTCLENSMDGGVWWASVHGVTKSWTWLSDTRIQTHTHTHTHAHTQVCFISDDVCSPFKLPASEIKQTFLSTSLGCLLALARWAARPHVPFGNSILVIELISLVLGRLIIFPFFFLFCA